MRVFIDTVTTGNDMNLAAKKPEVIVTFTGKLLLDENILTSIKDLNQLTAIINSKLDDETVTLAVNLLLIYPGNEDVLKLVTTIFAPTVSILRRIPTSEDASKWAITALRKLERL